MNRKRTLIALAAIVMAAMPMGLIMSDGSDAQISIGNGNDDIWGSGFTDRSDGTLYVVLKSDEPSGQRVTITVTKDGRELKSTTVTVPSDTEYPAELRFRLGAGEHTLTVTCKSENLVLIDVYGNPTDTYSSTVTVNSTQSILSKPSTYAAIAVVVILIAVAIYMHMRNAPTTKPDTTFTELERQKKESREEMEEAPKVSATERKKYADSGSRPKETAKPSPPPEEKKATSFTELEKEKKEKKEAPPPKKKESSSEEPKKLKYVSSRRK